MFTKEVLQILLEAIRFFRDLFTTKKAGDALVLMGEVYDNMKRVLTQTDAQRIDIFKAENNGGIIKPGCNIYTSIIYEDFSLPMKSIKMDYQRQMLDGRYNAKLVEVYQNGEKKICVDHISHGLFKTIYGSEGIRYAEMFYIHHDKKGFYYAVISSQSYCPAFQDINQRKAITVSINNIRNIFKKTL